MKTVSITFSTSSVYVMNISGKTTDFCRTEVLARVLKISVQPRSMNRTTHDQDQQIQNHDESISIKMQ